MLPVAEGRAHHAAGGIVPVLVLVFAVVEHEVLHQRLAEDALARLLGAADGIMRLLAGDMHDVERAARHVGDHDGAVGGFALHFRRARVGMALGAGDAAGQEIGLHARHHVAVLGMDQRQGAELGAALEGVVELIVIDHERALVGHEMLEGVDAVGLDHGLHLVVDLRAPLGDGHVEGIVRCRLLGLVAPGLVGLEHGFAGCGNAEVDDHGGAAGEARLGAPFEIVGRDGAHEHELHVGVRIDAARHDIAAAGVDDLLARQALADGDDPAAVDQDIGALRMIVIDDGAAADEGGHGA